MDDTHYSISEAGKLVGVESHVLRNWEDELQKSPVLYGASYSFISDDKRAEGKRISAESHRTGS